MHRRVNSRLAGRCKGVRGGLMAVVLDTAVAGLDAMNRPGAWLFDSADKEALNRLEGFWVLRPGSRLGREADSRFAFRSG